ncbi:hypothetical protein ACE193_04225 [Bernardetia sp. OM2101]|uniref:hypothetical protein n=1 Tax=Bernardetia sp. OM2101 TaxID=3344876 RepID=UPI0035D0F2F7
MKNSLTLTKKQASFLEENRQDPITGDKFKIGNEIVFCAECKSAFLKESWEYMGNRHCNQRETFTQIPQTRKIEVRRTVVTKYSIPFAPNLFISWMIDTGIFLLMVFITWHLMADYLDMYLNYFKIFVITLFLLKDNNLIFTSIGKKVRGVAIVYTKNHKILNPIFYPLRHLFSAISLTLVLYFEIITFVPSILTLIFILLAGVDLFQSLFFYKRMLDYLFGTALRQDNTVTEFNLPDYEYVNQDSFGEGYDDPTILDNF